MKTKTIIIDIDQEDLSDFFSTATYGSEYFDIKCPKGSYKGTDLEDDEDCREDMWAKVLLSGKPVYVYDYYSEEESYGDKPHKWIADKEAMRYTITLEDIKVGIQKCLDSDNDYLQKCARNLINGCYDLDLPEAEAILQVIVFGELIYG